MGLFTLMLTNETHLAPLVDVYVARDLGWRWCFFVGAGAMFVFMLQTLFNRTPNVEADVTPPELDDGEGSTSTSKDSP